MDRNKPLRELVSESRYADLIILNPGLSPDKNDSGIPTEFVKRSLEKSECPVIVASGSFETVDRLIFAYDGTLNSLYAIKQFSYLFPQFTDTPIALVEVLPEGRDCMTEKHKLHDWLGMHYSDVTLVTLRGNRPDELIEYLTDIDNAIIVMDGFGRGMLSKLLSPSVSAPVVGMIGLPVFIAHVPE